LIALLTLATFITIHLVTLTQKDSALLVNVSGSQRWLSQNLLTPENPHLTYLLQNSENLLESLDQIVSLYQEESEAKVLHLRLVEITSGVIILITLTFMGLYIFRPLANTLLKERS